MAKKSTTVAQFTITTKGLDVVAKTEQLTLQRTEKGMGANWRAAAKRAPNTRAVCLAAMCSSLPTGFTLAELQAFLQANREALLPASATVGSRMAALLKEGYIAEVA